FPPITKRHNIRMLLVFGRSIETAWGRCPKCGYVDNLYRSNGALTITYCRGGLPPEVEHEQRDILGQSQGTHRHQVICAHINFEHFHAGCKICDYHFGFRTPGGTNG
ncbi:MAG TPA: hypothetical protein VGF75_03650, partial [Candidatus Saccharimonadales bacterium]